VALVGGRFEFVCKEDEVLLGYETVTLIASSVAKSYVDVSLYLLCLVLWQAVKEVSLSRVHYSPTATTNQIDQNKKEAGKS
jgi:uncharacterized membrane protein